MENPFDFIEFRLDADKKLLYGKWLRDVNNAEYQSGLKYTYELIKDNAITRWLQNSTHLSPRALEDQKWVAEDFGLMLTQSPIKYIATVVPANSLHYPVLLSLREKAYRIFGKTKFMEIFETEEEALAWLIPNMQFYRLPAKILVPNTNHTL
ncbi:hypothetical protein [Pontibacter fetidus]|uniref:STAS/SEC14 domain-containing protein n=1 Tax=Pontibacter fetidus TaxID=2700082 RepID=A0A6B2GY74_9BACT|nr:hypothetical protein [Pontibacter fetidus]NDK55805.1 hypothetical protein [Pontibacter fetidus]